MTGGARTRVVRLAGAAAGVALFAWAVRLAGVDALVDLIRRIGWGWAAILALAGARFALRAQCWRGCLPPGVPLDFPHAFGAFLAGDAVGNVTPFGLLASEPTKVLLTRHHLATLDSVASLTLENILYSVSVLVMLASGLTLMLATIAVPQGVRLFAFGALAGIAAAAGIGVTALRVPLDVSGHAASSLRGRAVRLRDEVWRFGRDHPRRLARVFSLHLLFHVLAVAETWLTLQWLLGARSPTAVQAVIFEKVNRATIVLFKFIPFRIGVDEAASGAIAPLVAVTAAAGVALAVVRKGRNLTWSAAGLLILLAHPSRRVP